jgi:hypothetical protein
MPSTSRLARGFVSCRSRESTWGSKHDLGMEFFRFTAYVSTMETLNELLWRLS